MRLAIHDYSQEVASNMVDTVPVNGKEKKIAIDATDLLILDWFTKFYPFMDKKIIDGKEYGWIKRSKVLIDLPILRISEDAVSDRLRKLVHFKLLEYKLTKDSDGTRCYYRHGINYQSIVYDFSKLDGGCGVEQARGTGSTPHGVRGQTRNKDSSLYSNNKNKGKNLGKTDKKAHLQFSRCECGGMISKNTQLGTYSCISCGKEY